MDSVLLASRIVLPMPHEDGLYWLDSEPPGYEFLGSRVYVEDAGSYLEDLRRELAGVRALNEGLALLPGSDEPVYVELQFSAGKAALHALLRHWSRSADVVVWDAIDVPRSVVDFLAIE